MRKLPNLLLSNLSTTLIASALLLILAACGGDSETSAEDMASQGFQVVDVEPAEALKLIYDDEVLVLDVRTPEEYAEGHIANALNYNIHDDNFERSVRALDKTKPYLVHCAKGVAGGRSRRAIDVLKDSGAMKVYHLNGGFSAWQEAEQPFEKIEQQEQ